MNSSDGVDLTAFGLAVDDQPLTASAALTTTRSPRRSTASTNPRGSGGVTSGEAVEFATPEWVAWLNTRRAYYASLAELKSDARLRRKRLRQTRCSSVPACVGPGSASVPDAAVAEYLDGAEYADLVGLIQERLAFLESDSSGSRSADGDRPVLAQTCWRLSGLVGLLQRAKRETFQTVHRAEDTMSDDTILEIFSDYV